MTTQSIFRRRFILAVIISLVSVLSALSLFAAPATGVVFVSPNGSDDADCLSLATACRRVSVAISRAVAGDAVLIADGLYTDSFTINKPLTLIGYGSTQPIINGLGAPAPHRVITVSAGILATIQNLTIRHGDASSETLPYGGGILNAGVLTVSNSTVSDNLAADHGGGISNFEGTLYLLDSRIVDNKVFVPGFSSSFVNVQGGGIASLSGTVVIRLSEIMYNVLSPVAGPFTNGCGGGIENTNGMMTISDSHIVSNSITLRGAGGGICSDGSMVVERTDVGHNGAYVGMGIWNSGQLTLTQSLVHDNRRCFLAAQPALALARPQIPQPYAGGGIYNRGALVVSMSAIFGNCVPSNPYVSNGGGISNFGMATLTNVTLSNNVADYGAALAGNFALFNVTISGNYGQYGGSLGWDAGGSPVLTMQNTLIANQGQNCGQVIIKSIGHNLSSDDSCSLNASGDLTDTNPLLGPLQDNGGGTPTIALLYGSPAIDAGDNIGCPATDQRGVPRPQGVACDIGAYEETLIAHVLFPFVAR